MEPINIADFVQDDQGEDLNDARDGPEEAKSLVIVLAVGYLDVPFQLFQGLGQEIDCGKIDLHAFFNSRIFKPLLDDVPVASL